MALNDSDYIQNFMANILESLTELQCWYFDDDEKFHYLTNILLQYQTFVHREVRLYEEKQKNI